MVAQKSLSQLAGTRKWSMNSYFQTKKLLGRKFYKILSKLSKHFYKNLVYISGGTI